MVCVSCFALLKQITDDCSFSVEFFEGRFEEPGLQRVSDYEDECRL